MTDERAVGGGKFWGTLDQFLDELQALCFKHSVGIATTPGGYTEVFDLSAPGVEKRKIGEVLYCHAGRLGYSPSKKERI